MPMYTYRREDGTTFDYKQKFLDDPLTTDPQTGQRVVRVVQPAGIIFKGSGFYVTDSKNASKRNLSSPTNGTSEGTSSEAKDSKESTTETKDTKDTKETKTETSAVKSEAAAD